MYPIHPKNEIAKGKRTLKWGVELPNLNNYSNQHVKPSLKLKKFKGMLFAELHHCHICRDTAR